MSRARPNSDVLVSEVVAEDGSELVRIVGLDRCDYLTGGEASALADALAAAVNEVSSDDELAPGGNRAARPPSS